MTLVSFPSSMMDLFPTRVRRYVGLILWLCPFLLPGCASIYRPVTIPALSEGDIQMILSRMETQKGLVTSFYSLGTLSVKNWYSESEANLFMAGTQDPLNIKIEITHAWGQPFLHILIHQKSLKVLSFQDMALYVGTTTPGTLSRFIPGDLDPDLLWAALRAYPILGGRSRVSLSRTGAIMLFDEHGNEAAIIHLQPEALVPRQVVCLHSPMEVAFSEFQENNGISYAREVRVETKKGNGDLIFRNSKMVFNRSLPDQLFTLEKPPTFKTIYLE